MKTVFRTRTSRILTLCIIFFTAAGVAYEYYDGKVVNPTDWYFLSRNSDAPDIRSPTKKLIISMEYKIPSTSKLFLERCYGKLFYSGKYPAGAEYKGVRLCNIPGIDKNAFAIRHAYFKEEVDELWKKNRQRHITKMFSGVLKGVFVWVILVAGLFLARWVKRGDKTP